MINITYFKFEANCACLVTTMMLFALVLPDCAGSKKHTPCASN